MARVYPPESYVSVELDPPVSIPNGATISRIEYVPDGKLGFNDIRTISMKVNATKDPLGSVFETVMLTGHTIDETNNQMPIPKLFWEYLPGDQLSQLNVTASELEDPN